MTILQKFSAIVTKSFGLAESIFGQFADCLAGQPVEVIDAHTSTDKLTEGQSAEKSYRRGLKNAAKLFDALWPKKAYAPNTPAYSVPENEILAVRELLGRGQKYFGQISAVAKQVLMEGRRAELLDLFAKGISAGAIKDYFAPKAEKTAADKIEAAAGDLESAVKRLWLLGAGKVAGDTYENAVRESVAAKAKRDAAETPVNAPVNAPAEMPAAA